MLWDGNEVRSEVERQKARVNSASYRVDEAAEFVALNAIEAHLNSMRNQEIVRLNEANIEAHRRIRGQVEQLERGGGGDIADVQQTVARIAQAEASLATSAGDLADSLATYARVVGASPQNLSLEPAPLGQVPAAADQAVEAASVRSPTVQIAASDVDVSAAELRGTRANFYPRFDVEVASTAGNDLDGQKGSSVDASALLVLRYNLFRGGADIAREREAFHRVNESRAGLERARRQAEEEARFSFNALTTARSRTTALRGKAEAQRRSRDAYAQQFEIGQRDLLDVLDAENELFLARVGLVTAEYTERFAVYRLLAITGDLLEVLSIGAPREAVNINRAPADVQTPEAVARQVEAALRPEGRAACAARHRCRRAAARCAGSVDRAACGQHHGPGGSHRSNCGTPAHDPGGTGRFADIGCGQRTGPGRRTLAHGKRRCPADGRSGCIRACRAHEVGRCRGGGIERRGRDDDGGRVLHHREAGVRGGAIVADQAPAGFSRRSA